MTQSKVVDADPPRVDEGGSVLRLARLENSRWVFQGYSPKEDVWKTDVGLEGLYVHPLTDFATDENLSKFGYSQDQIERIMTNEFTGRRCEGGLTEEEETLGNAASSQKYLGQLKAYARGERTDDDGAPLPEFTRDSDETVSSEYRAAIAALFAWSRKLYAEAWDEWIANGGRDMRLDKG